MPSSGRQLRCGKDRHIDFLDFAVGGVSDEQAYPVLVSEDKQPITRGDGGGTRQGGLYCNITRQPLVDPALHPLLSVAAWAIPDTIERVTLNQWDVQQPRKPCLLKRISLVRQV